MIPKISKENHSEALSESQLFEKRRGAQPFFLTRFSDKLACDLIFNLYNSD